MNEFLKIDTEKEDLNKVQLNIETAVSSLLGAVREMNSKNDRLTAQLKEWGVKMDNFNFRLSTVERKVALGENR